MQRKVKFIDIDDEFPPLECALSDGLLAVGADLSRSRLLTAYRSGIFPWYNEGEPPMWWSPDPRFVMLPESLKVSKSMRSILNTNRFDFTANKAFEEVVEQCRTIVRPEQDGTWITQDVKHAYTDLHNAGYAISGEAWRNGVLVGGLYGVRIGDVFFGESMFSIESNASKFAFIRLVRLLQSCGVKLIDCQVHTDHLERLGAFMIPRAEFVALVSELTSREADK